MPSVWVLSYVERWEVNCHETIPLCVIAIDVHASNLTQTESGPPITLSVTLNTAPDFAVNVNVTAINCDRQYFIPKAPSLIFYNTSYSTAQTVQLHAINDNIMQGDTVCHLSLNASSDDIYFAGAHNNITIRLIDDDTAGIVVTAGSLLELQDDDSQLAISEGSTGYFGMSLHSQPLDAVDAIFEVASSRIIITTSANFTTHSWNSTQHVQLSAPSNGIAEGAKWDLLTISLATTDQEYLTLTREINFLVIDTDAPQVFQLSPPLANTTDRAGSATVSVILVLPISGPIHISIFTTSSGIATVQPSMITFTPDQLGHAQSVRITGVPDNIITGNQIYDVDFIASGSGVTTSASVELTNIDSDHAGLNCSKYYLVVNETGMFSCILPSAIHIR